MLFLKFLQNVNKGIATVILPNRQTDNEAGGSAAGQWAGQHQGNSGVQPPLQQSDSDQVWNISSDISHEI